MSGQIVPLCVNGDAASASPALGDGQKVPVEAMLATSVGQQLRAARSTQGLSAADIAKKLKLSTHQVEALEADDWSRLPCNTIIRGFVRNYARLLGLDSDALMAMLDRLQMPHTPELEMPVGTNVRVPQEGGVERRDYLRVFAGPAVLGLVVLAYFLFPQDLLQSTVATLKAMTLPREATVAKAVPAPTSVSVPAKVPEAPATTPLPATTAPALEPAIPVAQPAAIPAQLAPLASINPRPATPASIAPTADTPSRRNLKFTFNQPSWVEVRDRRGEVVFSQLCQAGSEREIEGQPPFALVIGNASHVTLQYNGKPVDLSKRSKEDVARVTVE